MLFDITMQAEYL